MKRTNIAVLGASLMVAVGLGGCVTHDQSRTTRTTTTATGATRTQVVKDVIPAEGGRKIPVTEGY
ncbi:MAG TPA: hypothetical protein VGK72_00480 [Chthoniobacterales bacterium]